MKTIRLFISIIILLICPIIFSCQKGSTPNCGCDSPILQNLPSTTGTLYYDNTKKQYSIVVGTPGLLSRYVLCDTTISQLQSIVSTNRDSTYHVLFSGYVKNFCPDPNLVYLDFMFNIELTAITKL